MKNRIRPALLLFLISILPFVPVLKAGYLNWDDDLYLTANPDIDSPQGWSDHLVRFHTDANVYPLVFASFRIENLIFGKSPSASHAINLCLHGMVAVTAFFLLSVGRRDWKAGFWAALLFAVHPLQVSTVAWVAERKSLLGSLFFLLALLVGTRQEGGRIPWWSLLLAAAAYLCKSPLVVFPVLLLATLQITPPSSNSPSPQCGEGVRGWGWRGWGVCTWISRTWGLPGRGSLEWGLRGCFFWGLHLLLAAGFAWIYSDREVNQPLTLIQRLNLVPLALWHDLSKWAYPVELTPIYPKWELEGDLESLAYWFAIFLALALLFLFRKKIEPLEWFGGGFFVVTLLPSLGLVGFGYQKYSFVSDHFMYLPVLGLSILLSSLMTRISIGRRILLPSACIGIVLFWGLLSWQQCRVWKSPENFWGSVLKANPESWIAHQNLATYLDQEGKIQEANGHYRRATEIDPGEPIGWINLGRNLIRLGNFEEAVGVLARAIDLNVFYVEAHLFRAEAFHRMGEEQKAVDQFHSALAVQPGNAEARLKIADLLLHARSTEVRDPERALEWLKPFEDVPPGTDTSQAWKLLAEAYAKQGNFERAMAYETQTLEVISDRNSTEALESQRRISLYRRQIPPGSPQ